MPAQDARHFSATSEKDWLGSARVDVLAAQDGRPLLGQMREAGSSRKQLVNA